MAKPLRIEVAGGWYPVMNRGHRGEALFLDDTDRRRFPGAVAELQERCVVEGHALVPTLADDTDRKRFVSKLKRPMSII